MHDQEAGNWLVWGTGPSAATRSDVFRSLRSALSRALDHLPLVDLDGEPAATGPTGPEPTRADPTRRPRDHTVDCGEGDLSDDLGDDDSLFALVHARDPGWTPPGDPHPTGATSWMEVLRGVTEGEVETFVAERSTARGSLRLD